MSEIEYVIVGAEVDEARRFLLPNGDISASDAPGARPLTVEFIGELMVELSKSGQAGVTAAQKDRFAEQVRNALRIKVLGGSGAPQLTPAEEQAILDSTTVSINFETRVATAGQTDRNTRILTVPSDNTLQIAADALAAASEVGFEPPLTYELDEALMLASQAETILEIIRSFGRMSVPGWTSELQTMLEAHVEGEIKRLTTFVEGAGGPSDSVLNEIMRSPLRAFHRSVGIYATNMCR